MGNQYNRKPIEYEINKNGCHICTSHSKDKEGYARYRVNGKLKRLHRVLYENKYGEIPKGRVLLHKCDNPSCINIEHLKLGTQKENVQDCIDKERRWIPKGTKNGKAKLTDSQIEKILKDDRTQKEIAKEYKVTQQHISAIKLHKFWA